MAKEYVKTYSSPNAAAQDSEGRVQLINIQYIQYKINSLNKNYKRKRKSKNHVGTYSSSDANAAAQDPDR